MQVLITGGAGFVGSHFVAHYEQAGHDVLTMDVAYDVAYQDVRGIGRYFPDLAVDLVIHCAAVVGGRKMIDGNPLAVATNLAIDHALFDWALKARPGRILYLSSSAAYPVRYQQEGTDFPLSEDDIDPDNFMEPDQTYGWAKLTGERLAVLTAAEGVPVHVVRPFSGYSESQSLDYPFPSFAARARRRDDPFEVWGNGQQVRDWIHIDDVIAACVAVIDRDVRHPVNLGTGRPTTFNQLASLFMAAAGYSAPVKHLEAEPSGVAYRVADVTLLNEIYRPCVSLEEGIERAMSVR